jgi:hypothetical protein
MFYQCQRERAGQVSIGALPILPRTERMNPPLILPMDSQLMLLY